MLCAKIYHNWPMFDGVIQKIKVSRFLLRQGVVEERTLSSPNCSSRGKTEALEFNSEIPRVSVLRQCRVNFLDNVEEISSTTLRKCFSQFLDNVKKLFRSNQLVCRSCNRPVEVVYRNTLIPIWFGHFWLATIWTTCLNQFIDNVEQIS